MSASVRRPPEESIDVASALGGARVGVWEWDLRAGVFRIDPRWCQELTVDACAGADHLECWARQIHPDDRAEFERQCASVRAGRLERFELEYRLQVSEARSVWILQRGRILERSSDGQALRVSGICMEVDERKSVEVALRAEQARAQEALRQSEFRYRTVASMAPGFIFEFRYNADGRLEGVWASEGMEAVLGCTLEETERRKGWETLLDEEFKPMARARQARVAQGEMQTGEVRVQAANGEKKWLQISIQPVRDPATGEVTGMVGSAYDITTRKQADEALRESQMTLQTVAASSADWLALFDRQRRCVFLNRPFNNLPAEAWIGCAVEDFSPPADRAYVHELFEHIMKTGEPRDFDQVMFDPQRGPRYLELRARAVQADGRIFGTVVNITDVTDRHAQQDVMRTQARIVQTMREGVVLVDASSYTIKLTNPAFDRMFRYGPQELLGRRVQPLFVLPAEHRKRLERTLHDSPDSTELIPAEFNCIRKDGSRFVATCVVTPLSIGGSDHWLAVLNDVTERKRLESEIILISNREQMRIGNDLHDGLGQDLTGIALMLRGIVAQLRKEGSPTSLDVEDVIGLVNNAIESTRSLARGLSPITEERGGLAAAIQSMTAMASERYGVRVNFRADFKEPLRLGENPATHVYRIVQEALTNVVRHSRATEVQVRMETCDGELHVRVEDNGRGFARAPSGDEDGLGLKIMRYRAQMMKGELVIESSATGGASVRCTCPLLPNSREAAGASFTDTP